MFESNEESDAAVDGTSPEPVACRVAGPGGGASGVANALGDPRAARAIAAANGSASLRFWRGAGSPSVRRGVSLGGGRGVLGRRGRGLRHRWCGGAGHRRRRRRRRRHVGVAPASGIGGPDRRLGGAGLARRQEPRAGFGVGGGARRRRRIGGFSGLPAATAAVSVPDSRAALALTAHAAIQRSGARSGSAGARSRRSASLCADVGADADLNAPPGIRRRDDMPIVVRRDHRRDRPPERGSQRRAGGGATASQSRPTGSAAGLAAKLRLMRERRTSLRAD